MLTSAFLYDTWIFDCFLRVGQDWGHSVRRTLFGLWGRYRCAIYRWAIPPPTLIILRVDLVHHFINTTSITLILTCKWSLHWTDCIPSTATSSTLCVTSHWLKSESESELHYNWQSVSMSWCRAQPGTFDQRFFFFKLLSCHMGAPSLTRGRAVLLL
jgi:hypothetical protein